MDQHDILINLKYINDLTRQAANEVIEERAPETFRALVKTYEEHWEKLQNAITKNASAESLRSSINSTLIRAAVVADAIINSDFSTPKSLEISKNISNTVKMISGDMNNKTSSSIDSGKFYIPGNSDFFDSEHENLEKRLKKTINEFETERKRNSNSLAKIQDQIESLDQRSENISKKIAAEIEKIQTIYTETENYLANRKIEVDSLTESISKDVFSGNYEERAAKEEQVADQLRKYSVISMAIAISIIAITVIDSSFHEYNWASSILRVGLIFAVTLPAAYFAKESSRHREKQNSYLEKSLDLKAISPFISSLDKSDQDKIKVHLSNRLFAVTRITDEDQKETPMNTAEILLEISDKLKRNN
ncbi:MULTISPECIES: hypothetical protein [Marinobacter]|uniref:hypothetical protein n=1 Tax=Marinobacter TaxID=2742 RepID=UPI003B43BF88|nr:hypothetical protein PBN92_16415 [Marinobacter alkaliphilus]